MLMSGKEKISLYFHIPFCTKKCSYCHFYVLPDKEPLKKQLMEGLKLEWEHLKAFVAEKEIETIYFGGGTPSLLAPFYIEEILSWIPFKKDIEITLEVNPETATKQLMLQYKNAGITRVSIGVQTLDNKLLKMLGRLHSASKARDAIFATFDAGIENISIDLMYDLPNQSLNNWEHTLKEAIALPITHLSLYNLTIEPHTLFFKQKEILQKLLPDEETSLNMYEMAAEILSEKLTQYEISAFSKPGMHSHHNIGYWKARPFFGLGPSAFSYYKNRRFQNIANLKSYHQKLIDGKSPIDFEEELEPLSRRRELLAINLRLMEGVNLKVFQEKHGALDEETFKTLSHLKENDLIKEDLSVKLTKRGILLYDTVATHLI